MALCVASVRLYSLAQLLLGRVRLATGDQPDMLVRQGDMRACAYRKWVHRARDDYRLLRTSAGSGQRAGGRLSGPYPEELHDAGGLRWIRAGKRSRRPLICRSISWRRALINPRMQFIIWRVRLTLTWPITLKLRAIAGQLICAKRIPAQTTLPGVTLPHHGLYQRDSPGD